MFKKLFSKLNALRLRRKERILREEFEIKSRLSSQALRRSIQQRIERGSNEDSIFSRRSEVISPEAIATIKREILNL